MSKWIRYTGGLANFLAILTLIMEVISGVILFMLATITFGIPFILPEYWDTLINALAIVIIISFIFTFLLLYTPLYEFLPYVTKIFLSSLLSIFTLLSPMIIGWYFLSSVESYLLFAFLAIVIYVVESIILYAMYAVRGKKLAQVIRHRKALEEISHGIEKLAKLSIEKKDLEPIVEASNKAYHSWSLIVKHEIIERWDLSRVLFQSLVISMAFYLVGITISIKIVGYETFASASSIGLFVFIIILALIDLIQCEKLRSTIH